MKKKRNGARLLSLLLAVTLILGNVGIVRAEEMTSIAEEKQTVKKETKATGLGVTVTLQIEGYGYTIEEGVKVKMPDTYKTFAEYGLTEISEPKDPGFTMLHVMAEYCEQTYGEGAAADLIQCSNWITGFMGLPEKSALMFLRNHEGLNVGANDQKIESGDLLTVVDIWANSSWTIGGQYAWFKQPHVEAEAGTTFTMQMQTTALMYGEKSNPAGATVQVYDGDTLVTSGVTDADGKVSLTVDTAGDYTVTAERKSESYDTDMSHPYDITRPHGTVTITPEREVTDEEAVQVASDELSLGDLSNVKDNLKLPVSGSKKTTISWKSDDPDVVNEKGEITRSYGADNKAKLTATIARGTVKAEKIFEVTVIGYSLKLKTLEVGGSQIAFSPDQNYYVAYVPENAEKVKITAEAQETFPTIWFYINGECIFGDSKGTKEIVFPVDKESIEIPVEVKNKFNGDITSCTTILVKRAGNPGEPLPDLPDITWGQHLGNKDNNAVVDAKTPTKNGELLWESFSDAPDNWGSVYAGTPILINNSIYAVRNNKIEMLDAKTGEVKASAPLSAEVGFYSNITYGGGMIFVPLGNGMIDCFRADTLKRLYVTEQPGGPLDGLSVYGSIHYENGKIYVGYADWGSNGYYAAYDTLDTNVDSENEIITPLWKTEKPVSYYGSGAVTTDKYVAIAGGDGVVSVLDKDTGKEVSFCQAQGKVASALVMSDGYIWTTTQDAQIYKLSLRADGNIEIEKKKSLPLMSNTSPVVIGGKVYVTGGDFNNGGFFAVYDTELNKLAEERTEGQVNTPTVTTAYDDIYVYFTENSEKGTLYMAKVSGSNKISIELTELFVPAHPQYSMCKVVVGADGTLYYGNDAGYLYAVKQGAGEPVPEPEPTPEPKPEPKPEPTPEPEPEDSKETITTTVKKFKPVKKTINASSKGNKSDSENIAEAVKRAAEKGEKKLTVKNVPEIIGAEVFEVLKDLPDFQLVLDCGKYTISLKGADVTNSKAALNTRLVEMKNTLSEEDAQMVGSYQQLALIQERPFPGKITVVYKLPEQLKGCEQLYLYALGDLSQVWDTVVNSGYAMFTLEEAGEYILADQKVEDIGVMKAEARMLSDDMIPAQSEEKSMTTWILIILGIAGGLGVGAVIGRNMAVSKRKKEDTWEK